MEKDAFTVMTKHGGAVKCDFFEACGGKLEGAGCVDCRRNTFSATKSEDNYIPISEEEVISVDNLVGVADFGEVRISLAPDWKNVKIFFGGVESKDVAGLQISAGPNMFTQCHLIITKPKEKK